jgi:putative ABC transport system permease protein
MLWPGRSPLGQRVALGPDRAPAIVVGVVADYRHRSLTQPFAPIVFRPYRESDLGDTFSVVARTDGDRGPLVAGIRDAVRAVAPAVPIALLATMTEQMDGARWPTRTLAGLFLVCGVLALVMATVGLFGVTYYAVRQRTREFGIRIALGASRQTVVSHVLLDGLRIAIPGAIIGLAAAAVGGRLLARALLGVTPADGISFGGAAAIEIVVALCACAVPARRATQADPVEALRDQ